MAVVPVVGRARQAQGKFLDMDRYGSRESLERGRPTARIWQAAADQANLAKWHYMARAPSGPSVWLFSILHSTFHLWDEFEQGGDSTTHDNPRHASNSNYMNHHGISARPPLLVAGTGPIARHHPDLSMRQGQEDPAQRQLVDATSMARPPISVDSYCLTRIRRRS